MKGEMIVKKKKAIEYCGEHFRYELPEKQYKKFSKLIEKNGVDKGMQVVALKIQKKMKKYVDSQSTGEHYDKDFATILASVKTDLQDHITFD